MQTALHITALMTEIRREAIGSVIAGTEYYRKERAAYFFLKGKSGTQALGFVFHPAGHGTFLVPASKVAIDTREKPWPIFEIEGAELIGVEQATLDRIFELRLRKGNMESILVVEALGPSGNIWLLDSARGKQKTLRNREFSSGEPYEIKETPAKLNPFELEPPTLADSIRENETELPISLWVEKNILGFNKTLAKEAAHRAGLMETNTAQIDDAGARGLAEVCAELASRFKNPEQGNLYIVAGSAEVYPFKLSLVAAPEEKHKTLSLAVQAMTQHRQTSVEQSDRQQVVVKVVDKGIKRLEKRIEHVQKDIAEAANFDQYRRYTELLQTNFHVLKRGMAAVEVDDHYADTVQRVVIPLDPALTPNDNIENYARRYRKGKEGLELLERRLLISREELAELQRMRNELEANFDAAEEKYRAEIEALLPREKADNGGGTAPRLPYKPYTLSTGLTIFVGRDGSDNDRTTFEFAKPFELWFHTQQCPGSHVVMKFPNKSFEPSRLEIEETASVAAFHSKARNDSLVPVVYAERRYVRKPRGAKPGLVTVEREKSVMVPPKAPDKGE